MIVGAALALAIAVAWTLLAISVGAGVGRAAERRRHARYLRRLAVLWNAAYDAAVANYVSDEGYDALEAMDALVTKLTAHDAHEPVVHEHGHELRASRNL